jgi:biotin carboxyl carrier protein
MPEYEIFVNSKPRKIELTKTGEDSFNAKMDGKPHKVELRAQTLTLGKPFTVKVDDKSYQVELPQIDQGKELIAKVDDMALKAEIKTPPRKTAATVFEPAIATLTKRSGANKQALEGAVTAPMTGRVISIKVKKGDQVKAGQVVCVVEAMKMENEIAARKAGTVKDVYVNEGSSVSEGEPILLID